MAIAKLIRIPLLVALCLSSLGTLIKILWLDQSISTRETTSIFSEEIALSGWRFRDVQPLLDAAGEPLTEKNPAELLAAGTYIYQQDDYHLKIDMHYLIHLDPNLRNLMLKYEKETPKTPFISTIQENEFGSYSLFTEQDNAYLSSCINPRGETTVTAAQFTQNRYTYDLKVDRLIPILLGQTTLQDARCLWVHMTLPINPEQSQEETFQTLETTWADWYETWQPRFPDD